MAWSFLLDFNDGQGDRDITALVDLQSIRRKFTLWNDLSPTANTLTFDLNRSPTILTLLLTNEKDTDITVTKDAAAYFKGTVRPNFKVSVGPTVKQTKIECVDLAEKLKRKIDTTFAWESYKVCDTSTPASSILHQLLIKAGFELGDINVSVDIDKTIDFFVNVPVHADQTYWDALTSILFEFGYMWYFDAAGEFNIYDFLPTDTSTSDAFDNDNMLGELAISKKLMSYEGTEVRFTAHKTEAGALVFNDTTGGTSELPCNISLDPAENYPEGSADRYVYSEYQFEGGDIVIVKDAAISVTKETGIDYDDAFVSYFKRALFSFINNAGAAKAITKLQITGDVTYKGDLTKCRCLLMENTEKLFTYDGAWITATADGDKLAIGLARHFKYSDFQYSLHSKEAYGLGAFVDIQDEMLAINNRCVIVGIEDINAVTGEQIFSLEGIEEYSAEDVESEGTFTPAPPPAPGSGPTITEGTAPSYTEIIEGFTDGGGTKTPTQVTVSECKPLGLRANILRWDRQLNLTNFDHYEIQTSADQSHWYALKSDGTDWKGAEDDTTDLYGEMIIHENIPPAGTADLPTAFVLYYRVRRVTKAPVSGDWSATANATFNLITSAYIQEDAITSEKLIDLAVSAAKIAALAVTEGKIAASAVVADKIAANAVTTDKLLALNVTAAKLAAGSVETAKIAALAVTAGCISANAVETAKIAANAITADKILAAAIQVMLLRASTIWIGYEGTGTHDDPDEGDRRIYEDGDEIKFQIYTGGAWSSVRQIVLGGVDANGNFRPFLSCRGLLGDMNNLPEGDPVPDSSFYRFDFEGDYADQYGNDPWTVVAGTRGLNSTYKWEGTYSLYDASAITTLHMQWQADKWNAGHSFTVCLMCRYRADVTGSLFTMGTYGGNDYVHVGRGSNDTLQILVRQGGSTVQTVYTAATIAIGTWYFVGVSYDSAANKLYVRINGVTYEYSPTGTWTASPAAGSGYFSLYANINSSSWNTYLDDAIVSFMSAVDPDVFLQHVLRERPWTADFATPDLLLAPRSGGVVRLLGDAAVSGELAVSGDIFEPSGKVYDTGWVACSDWTDQHLGDTLGANVVHGFNVPISDLMVKVFISTDGTDANSFEATFSGGSGLYGWTVYQIDLNTLKVQTADDGVLAYTDAGNALIIDTEAYYYKVKVWELG